MFNINNKTKYNGGSRFIKLYSACLKQSPKYSKGLTLIELMVVIGIFLMITSVVIFNYGSFNSTISLQNLTDDIALSIRKAQSFAIGARGVGTDFKNSYGVHFSINPSQANLESSSKSFLMFSVPTTVTVANRKYTTGQGPCGDSLNNSCVEFFNIMTADYIKQINVYTNGVMTPIGQNEFLDIVFTRPNPRADICYRQSLSSSCITVSNIEIIISNGKLEGGKEKYKMISVQNTGQISIQNYDGQ